MNTSDAPLVLLVHGIRTQAHWQGWLKDQLVARGAAASSLKYGYVDVFRFLFPLWTRNAPIRTLENKIKDAISIHQGKPVIIIAHSFGTYAVTKILERHPDIRPSRLLLCGSIVSRSFRWTRFAQLSTGTAILNDCGHWDIWPVLAQGVTFGYGASGTFGFGDAAVEDRFYNFGHSGFFNSDFTSRFWLPWIFEGKVNRPEFERTRSAPVLALSWLAGLKWIILIAVVAVSVFRYRSTISDRVTDILAIIVKQSDSDVDELKATFKHRCELIDEQFGQIIAQLNEAKKGHTSGKVQTLRRRQDRMLVVATSSRESFLRLCSKFQESIAKKDFTVAGQIAHDLHALLNAPEIDSLFKEWHEFRIPGPAGRVDVGGQMFHPREVFFQPLPERRPSGLRADSSGWQFFGSSARENALLEPPENLPSIETSGR